MLNESTLNLNGTTFGSKKWSVGKGQRVWREIRHRFPAGGKVANFAQFKELGVVPSGSPVVFNDSTYEIYAITGVAYDENKTYAVGDTCMNGSKIYKCKTAITTPEVFTSSKWEEVKSISGYLQEDIVIGDETEAATGTVIYAGEIYGYMFDSALLNVIKPISPAEIHFVN